jgi:protein ImuB
MAARGPARHQGGEERLAERIIDAVADRTGWDCQVGVADGSFAALLAARAGRIIRPGRSADYLAPHGIGGLREIPGAVKDLAEVIDLLSRLGIRTLGDFADLPSASVQARFGPEVARLHLLASGGEIEPPATHHPEQAIEVVRVMDPPLVRSDQAAFAARPMAEELHGMLVARGLICTRLRILAHTADGDELERTWRHDGALIPADVVDRVRWQCDGWITQASLRRGRGGGGEQVGAITRLALHPVQLLPAGLGAPTLWGSAGESAGRAGRAFARAQGLAGEEAVLVAADVGGRLLSEQVRMIPWRSEPPDAQPGPWPGSLPRPLPATVFRLPPAVQVRAADGGEVEVTTRGVLSAPPVRLLVPRESADALGALETGRWYPVEAYGAPTVLDERWWSPGGHHTVRLPVVVADGAEKQVALLLLCHEEGWRVEGVYD